MMLSSLHFLQSRAFHSQAIQHPIKTVFSRTQFVARVNKQRHFLSSPSTLLFSTQSHDGIPSNQQLVQKRLEVARAKKDARQKSIEETTRRHLHIKKVVQASEKQESSEFQVPALYAVKISVCEDLRNELRLSGRERRGRVFIEIGSPATTTLKALKQEIHAFFRALKKSTFVLSACLPEVLEDGSIVPPENMETATTWKIEGDEDVAKTFSMADKMFTSTEGLKRPSIVLHLTKDPNAPPPPPQPAYLESMADPSKSSSMSMISFYSFPPAGIEDPEEFALRLRQAWKPFEALGRVYVASEGVNAQMSVPTNV